MAGAAPFDPLEGPRKRLGRFTSQTRSLGELLAAHMERAAYHTVREVDPETGDIVWRAAIGEPIPGEISERLGEIVDTLRSPLDEIAWNFARLHDDPPPDDTSFVITRTEAEWNAEKWHVDGVGPDAARVMEEVQPYNTSHPTAPVEQHPLWVLERLWKADEHTSPHLIPAVAPQSQVRISTYVSKDGVPPRQRVTFGPFENNAELARFTPPSGVDDEFDVDFDVVVEIAFGNSGPVHGLSVNYLAVLHRFLTRMVLPRFDAIV
jgi:hypothetical protein